MIGEKLGTFEGYVVGVFGFLAVCMFERREDFDLLGISGGMKYGTGQGPYGEVIGTILGAADRRKPGSDEGADMVSSDGSFYEPNYGRLEGVSTG